jgi:hypothetical protein
MTRLRLSVCSFIVTLGALAQPAPAWSITAWQIDDFQDGTTAGWGVGVVSPVPPVNVASGGPDGAGDAYLELTSLGGGGPGSRLAVDNDLQWAGDYLAEGITGVVLDANLFSANPVSLRLGLIGPGGAFASATPVVLPAFSGWQLAEFSLDAADLVAVSEGATLNLTLSNVTSLRVFHSAGPPTLPAGGIPNGEPIVASLGFDNIEAIPEPAQPVFLAAGLATLLSLPRWRARAMRV